MSIDRTQPLKPVSQVQQREPGEVSKPKRKQTEAQTEISATQVKLSDAQAKLMQPGASDIDLNRVETLKQAIRDGSLKIDVEKIADALIKDTQDFLASN
ncbi:MULTISPECIES: flagellar biosynthesis anti-sigma factor FlgM [unclassified Brenneria]|uniref:flagellar biosynthesis anti-sigma factor FlgM n=1 Tax=unclassified Brenneria TaxID=2634434 RepID=UPI0029C10562|nr:MULTISPECIES: flagellar biosynthesis anti-sigma factor FlgM [unclassified Brenneria]MDX5630698.1 flagellar biosynthesis anti-sigma factor FlgM [Brenneria sp. L3-3Z]MDX5694250.1 flagellar biosynthesis anti-sigma factor FlgM [Brenneria sp. L4-2C]MEE3662522.1 flagellar biosynthesis anti-sigma factor FlgM [Brenneria sp. g21c3]